MAGQGEHVVKGEVAKGGPIAAASRTRMSFAGPIRSLS
jgi:hypothetical protein